MKEINIKNQTYYKVDGSIQEENENKCLTFASTDKNKEVLKNTQNFRIRLRIWLK